MAKRPEKNNKTVVLLRGCSYTVFVSFDGSILFSNLLL